MSHNPATESTSTQGRKELATPVSLLGERETVTTRFTVGDMHVPGRLIPHILSYS